MNRNQFFQSMKSIFDSMLALVEAKNADYASSDNPFRNFTTIEAFNLMPAEQAIFVRMSDKMSRIATGLKQTLMVKDESLEDTLKDLANYAVILAVYLRYKNAQTKAVTLGETITIPSHLGEFMKSSHIDTAPVRPLA